MPQLYEPLDVEKYEIRLLTISPGPPDSVVCCWLEKASLVKRNNYAALSYCWGDLNITEKIIVNNIETSVTVNLADALRQLRHLGIERIWADALCINQADRQEKSHQIRNMKHIYSKADEVYAFLGLGLPGDSMEAISFLQALLHPDFETRRKLSSMPHREKCPRKSMSLSTRFQGAPPSTAPSVVFTDGNKPTRNCQGCKAEWIFWKLQKLFERPYWRRRWIIQEVAVPSQVFVLCGSVKFDLDRMERAVARARKSDYWKPTTDQSFLYMRRVLEFRAEYHAHGISLAQAIEISHGFLSSDARDKIFALLGICYDGGDLVPTPNYEQSPKMITKELTRSIIAKYKSLDFILRSVDERPNRSQPLPTWTPHWLDDIATGSSAQSVVHCEPGNANTIGASATAVDDGDILKVESFRIGRISSTTTPTHLKKAQATHESPETSSYNPATSKAYYENDSELFTALCACFVQTHRRRIYPRVMASRAVTSQSKDIAISNHSPGGEKPLLWREVLGNSRTLCLWRAFPILWALGRLNSNENYDDQLSESCAQQLLDIGGWFQDNSSFSVNGKSLKGWAVSGITSSSAVTIIPNLAALASFSVRLNPATELLICFVSVPVLFFLVNPIIIIMVGLAIWACSEDIPMILQEISKSLNDVALLGNVPRRLFLADDAFIGMASHRVEPGDELYYIRRCSTPVVLRPVPKGQKVQYRIISDAFICLSNEDQKNFEIFRRFLEYDDRDQYLDISEIWDIKQIELI